MYWKLLVTLAAGMAAAPAGLPVNPDSCVLQKNTTMEQFNLSLLDELSGEVLTTESNGNIYFVSICRPVPEAFYDPRKMAGALKLSSGGHWVELGRIDQSNIVVNENTIVLTYDGGDVDGSPKATCKGLRWNTYVTFVCDPSATKDILTLLDEDADQPEICQVWFEIRTTKTCDRHPFMPLGVLQKDLVIEKRLIQNEVQSKLNENSSNKELNEQKSYDNEHSSSTSNKNSSLNNTNENTSNSKSIDSELQPFINVYPKSVYEKKSTNNEKPGNKFDKFINRSSKHDNEVVQRNNNKNEENINDNSTLIKPNYHLPENNSPARSENEISHQNTESNDNSPKNDNKNTIKNNKTTNQDNMKSNNSTQTIPSNKGTKPSAQKEDNPYKNTPNNQNNNKISEENSKTGDNHAQNKNPQDKTSSNNKNNPGSKNNSENINLSNNVLPDNEMNNTVNNVNPLDNINKTNQSNSKNSNLENEHSSDENSTLGKGDTSTNSQVAKNKNANPIDTQNNNPGGDLSQNSRKTDDVIKSNNSTSPNTDDNGNNQSASEKVTTKISKGPSGHDDGTNDVRENNSKINSNSTENVNGTTGITIKPSVNDLSKITPKNYPSESDDVDTTTATTSTDQSLIFKVKNTNQINIADQPNGSTESSESKSNQDPQSSDQTPQSSDSNSQGSSTNPSISNDDNTNATLSSLLSQMESEFSLANLKALYTKMFPDGFSFSKVQILVGIASLTAVYTAVATAINRFYYKKTGTDQLPHKDSFLKLLNGIKYLITKGFGGSDAPDDENSPLLKPPNNGADNEQQKKSKDDKKGNSDDDGDDGSNNKGGYGSISPTSDTNAEKTSKSKKNKDLNDPGSSFFGEAENLLKKELHLEGSTPKEAVTGKIKSVFKTKVIPAVVNFLKKSGINFEKIAEEEKEVASFLAKNVESHLSESQKKKLADIEKGLEEVLDTAAAEVKTNNGVDAQSKQNKEKPPTVVNEINEKEDTGNRQKTNREPTGKPMNAEPSLERKKRSDVASDESKSTKVPVPANGETKSSGETQSVPKNPIFEMCSTAKTNESKNKNLGLNGKDGDEKSARTNGDDDSTEYIEEIVYVDAEDGEAGEEIVEEITETITTEEPDAFDPEHPGAGTVTVKKTVRKVSSSAEPGVVQTFENTEVIDGDREAAGKKPPRAPFGIKLGVGKSGVTASVGDKKLGVGASGVKIGKRDDRTDSAASEAVSLTLNGSGLKVDGAAANGSAANEASSAVPKKHKKSKSIPNFSMFKRSVSQPAETEQLRESADEYPSDAVAAPKKSSRGSAGLLIFGKSRSKSTGFLEVEDPVAITDPGVVSDFIDQERRASLLSKVGISSNGSPTPFVLASEEDRSSPRLWSETAAADEKPAQPPFAGKKLSGTPAATGAKGKKIGDQLLSIKKAVKKKSDSHAEKHAAKASKNSKR